jgi:hypothetical protein
VLLVASCGGKVVVDAAATSGAGGSGGVAGTGGAIACTAIVGLCQAYCDHCGSAEGPTCFPDCLGYYEGTYPTCADAYAAHLACKVAHVTEPLACGGTPAACAATEAAMGACQKTASNGCNGFTCEGCSCKTNCATTFASTYADGLYTCMVNGKEVGTCGEKCMAATLADCCAPLFFEVCPP